MGPNWYIYILWSIWSRIIWFNSTSFLSDPTPDDLIGSGHTVKEEQELISTCIDIFIFHNELKLSCLFSLSYLKVKKILRLVRKKQSKFFLNNPRTKNQTTKHKSFSGLGIGMEDIIFFFFSFILTWKLFFYIFLLEENLCILLGNIFFFD